MLPSDIPCCLPVQRLVEHLEKRGFVVTASRLRDYHFAEVHIIMSGDINLIKDTQFEGFTRKENAFTCDCHWSTVELVME